MFKLKRSYIVWILIIIAIILLFLWGTGRLDWLMAMFTKTKSVKLIDSPSPQSNIPTDVPPPAPVVDTQLIHDAPVEGYRKFNYY